MTDWQALKNRMETDIANGDFMTQSYQIGDRQFTYRSVKEMRSAIAWIDEQAKLQSGGAGRIRRIRCVASPDGKFS